MSATILKLIPTNPEFIPEPQAQEEALYILRTTMTPSCMIRVVISDDIQFIDQGQNWEHVFCPACDQQIDEWWTHAMDIAHAEKFQNLEVQVPRCGKTCLLNNLIYAWPAGFARCVIEVENPAILLSDGQRRLVEEKLGCELRAIWAHY